MLGPFPTSTSPRVYERILTSGPFVFVVGPGKQHVMVHSQAIARLSPALNMLICGPMREAQEKSAELVDVEVGDFVRLCEFAYTGDYTPPKSTVESTCDYTLKFEIPSEISDDGLDASCIEDSPEGHLAPPLSQGHGMEGDRTRSRRKGNTTDKMSSNWKGSESDEESKKAELPEKFKSKAYHRIRTHGVAPKASPEPAAIDALEDFTTVFLGHAPQHSIQRFSTSGSGGVRGRGDRHHWKINALLCSDR